MKDQVTYYKLKNGEYVSQHRAQLCWPTNKDQTEFNLLASNFNVLKTLYHVNDAIETKKIPLDIKNRHRVKFGLKPVTATTWSK